MLGYYKFKEKLRVAIIGQSQFAAEVYKQVRSSGHDVVGVFTVPDVGGREDPVAETAKKDGVKARLEVNFCQTCTLFSPGYKLRFYHSEGVQAQDLAKEGRRAARGRRGVQVFGSRPERDAVLLAIHPDGGDQHAEAQEHLLPPLDSTAPPRSIGNQGKVAVMQSEL